MSLILSASSISTYLRCKRAYLYSNIYRVAAPQSIPAAIGTALHAGVEALWKSPRRPLTVLRETWETQLALVPTPYEDDPIAAFKDTQRLYTNYVQKVAPTFTPTLIEEKFSIEVEGISLTGTIDAGDPETFDTVRDLKTTAMISKFDPLGYTLQLSLYSLGYRFLTGHTPRKLLLDVLPRRGNFVYRQYEVQPEVGELLDVIGIVRDGIMAEDYSPTGAINGACRFCAYKEICLDAVID